MKAVLLLLLISSFSARARDVVIGSKKFTESVLLSEVLRLSLKHDGVSAEHKAEFGGTRILWNALKSGDIDVYSEYSGTLEEEIFRRKTKDRAELEELLRREGLGLGPALGFNNTYALGMKRARAEQLGIQRISDLARHPKIKIGISHEFRSRRDGWPGLRKSYRLPFKTVGALDHDVAYRALEQGDIEVTDLYTTDAEIPYYDITVLEDDRNYFPRYDGIFVYRLDKGEQLRTTLAKLGGRFSEARMIAMNKKAKIDKLPSNQVAAEFLHDELSEDVAIQALTLKERLWRTSKAHLRLVLVSMALAILVAIPLGLVVAKRQHLGKGILVIVSTIQTIPALALLVLMIKPLGMLGLSGIGDTPATIALFLYSLLPIVRNTLTGIEQVPRSLQEVAEVLDLSPWTRLRKIELPLAVPSILAGIKTALVLNVGFATLGALIGAGGYGQPILTGIRLDDYGLILEGAVPAAVLALLCQWGFDVIERRIVSPGIR